MATKDMDKLVNHAKSTGFVYQGSEIYDGLANTWDYGPLGVEMKNNIKRLWWKRFSYFHESKGMGSFRTCWWFL